MSAGAETTCRDCRFWTPLRGHDKLGECHRNAPNGTVTMANENHPKAYHRFPRVWASEWCGEWVLRAND